MGITSIGNILPGVEMVVVDPGTAVVVLGGLVVVV